MRAINEAGLRLIKSFEGCRLTAYQDVGGLWTIGYGHIRNVQPGQTISMDVADDLLLEDIAVSEIEVQTYIHAPLTDNQFSALVSLVFNCGRSVLTGHVGMYCNIKEYQKAADWFLRWDMCKGVVVPGLYDRRTMERALFLKPDEA